MVPRYQGRAYHLIWSVVIREIDTLKQELGRLKKLARHTTLKHETPLRMNADTI